MVEQDSSERGIVIGKKHIKILRNSSTKSATLETRKNGK